MTQKKTQKTVTFPLHFPRTRPASYRAFNRTKPSPEQLVSWKNIVLPIFGLRADRSKSGKYAIDGAAAGPMSTGRRKHCFAFSPVLVTKMLHTSSAISVTAAIFSTTRRSGSGCRTESLATRHSIAIARHKVRKCREVIWTRPAGRGEHATFIGALICGGTSAI